MTYNSAPRLELISLSKSFPKVRANDQISMRLMPGEIHAVIGENGAGKSTLMNIIYGVLTPDSGQIIWEGRQVSIDSPQKAAKLGIGMVFQHFCLLETLSVRDNLRLGLRNIEISHKELEDKVTALANDYGLSVDMNSMVADLTAGQKQRVEIIRCLLQKSRLLILDEPTSVLTPTETDQLMDILQKLAAQNCSVLFISHKLREVKHLCHTATVLRAGKVVCKINPKTASINEIAEALLGKHIDISRRFTAGNPGPLRFRLESVCTSASGGRGNRLQDISFDVHSGEILGIAGVAGNGQDELIDLINGELPACNGAVYLEGLNVSNLHPQMRRRAGIACLPVDRLGQSAVATYSLEQNYLLTASATEKSVLIDWKKIRACTEKICTGFNVVAPDTRVAAKSLSGGNMQKFLVGRELSQARKLLVCYNPTWGIDLGSARQILQAIVDQRDAGLAVILISEDLDELMSVSDRIGALCGGRMSPTAKTIDVSISQIGQCDALENEAA